LFNLRYDRLLRIAHALPVIWRTGIENALGGCQAGVNNATGASAKDTAHFIPSTNALLSSAASGLGGSRAGDSGDDDSRITHLDVVMEA
jgi:hypothetical protein